MNRGWIGNAEILEFMHLRYYNLELVHQRRVLCRVLQSGRGSLAIGPPGDFAVIKMTGFGP